MVRTRYGRVEVTYTAWEKTQPYPYIFHRTQAGITLALDNSDVTGHFDLSGGLDAADAADVEQSPGSHQGQHHPPLWTPRIINSCGGVQRLSVPEVVDGAAPSAFLHLAWKEEEKEEATWGTLHSQSTANV